METFQTKIQRNYAKPLKMSSIEETIQLARLQQAANSSSLYERKPNQKALKVLTVAAYILFVSMAAIILSFYYVFIWDPNTKSMAARPPTNCVETAKKIVIPESIAIKLANSSEVSAEYFFHDMYRRYQQLQNKDRKGLKSSKRNRIHKVPSSELAANREHKKLLETIRSTTSTVDISSISDRSTTIPFQQQQQQQLQTTTSNSYILQTKDQVAYVDDEDLENDLEASGLNRIRNETSIAYHFDENSENDN